MLKLTITQAEFSKFKLIAILMGLLKEYKTLEITVNYGEKIDDIPETTTVPKQEDITSSEG